MDPHLTRKPPPPPGISGGGGGSSFAQNGTLQTGPRGHLAGELDNQPDEQQQHDLDLGQSLGDEGEGDSFDSDLAQSSNVVLLECTRSLLRRPSTSDVARDLIGKSMTQISALNATNSSYLIDPITLEGYLPEQSTGMEAAGGWFQWPGSNFYNNQTTADPNQVMNFLNLYKLAERLPAAESPYQLEALGHRWQIFLAIIYSLTAITSFLLNMITVVVLWRCQRSELRKYLINLSLSDLLMSLLSIPFTYTEYMLGYWIFASFLCPIVRFVVTLSVFVSIATMTVIGINRHLAIMYPLKRKKYSKLKHWTMWRKTHVIVGIWLLGIAISLPEYLMFSARPFCYNKQLYYDCRHSWPDSISNSYTIFIYLATFVIPLALLSYLYTSIGLKLWRRRMPGNVDVNRDLTMQMKRAKVVKMLLVVVVLFAVFWLPLQTFSMIMYIYPQIRVQFEYQSTGFYLFVASYFLCHWLSMAHSCLNPLVYCFMNKKFRMDLRNLICGLRRTCGAGVGCVGAGGTGGPGGCGGLKSHYNSESYNSQATFRAHANLQSQSNTTALSHTRSGNSQKSNSVRLKSQSSSSSPRPLSKTNSLGSGARPITSQPLGQTTSGHDEQQVVSAGEGQAQEFGPDGSAERAQPAPGLISRLKRHSLGQLVGLKSVVNFNCSSGKLAELEQAPRPGSQFSPERTSPNSDPSDGRPGLMGKLSGSSAEVLHEIDEEEEEEEEEDEDGEESDGEDEEEEQEEESNDEEDCEARVAAGRKVTIRRHEEEFVILERELANSRPEAEIQTDEQVRGGDRVTNL